MTYSTIAFKAKAPLPAISPIEDIIEDIRLGKMVVLMDDEDRENEGDLIMAADAAYAQAINFMAMHGRGLICLTLTETRCRQLDLPLMVGHNGTSLGTNFTVSIEAAEGVTTGISTADRARTIQAAVASNAGPADIVSPGHIFPLMAQQAGVLKRAGHTEAGCDLAQLAGREPAAVICEIMNDDGSMARLPDLLAFANKHDLKVGTIADLIAYRHQQETIIERIDSRSLSTIFGEFTLSRYRDIHSSEVHQALVFGDVSAAQNTLVRVHAPFNGLDLLDSDRRGHSWSVTEAMQAIRKAGTGVLLLMHDDGIGESNDIPRLKLKHYGVGAQILKDLGVTGMTLLTRPRILPAMTGFGLTVHDFLLPDAETEKEQASA
ncbi:bifunctional 3,4-dihydroxy-2-butanone-4-phosphate synthase/GTP cyclohydrolase II [Methylophaga sp. OBS1]|uniref:bifunctional 3,4-dihydroxy-2-butanone-4-phosphate synthase/GTP cyclohydrolase II n=1 Tax=Methylophaga sp. OBS1 TaxID=2991933 RepID=UPI002259D763|nr:bifunctional 3,4-dihydroxy-2-butanone-4-phosphate synthase/GTP cyclohydrolase II [Methylophaga sp. OBS1]MCX4191047.1 bifunctional 3,4-dihydroxy-2-butanone-4-phosphate synthase/GTP cyclohydrolase II [Methylophaga sp. OBS1]MCX4192007.1 bifunctional 3,4-dihydroxy-2-butanone-4-phosphate synthase/GTP cyclohydrolase II [Methylophaga sp. OBS1]